jgi:hypothetical protein
LFVHSLLVIPFSVICFTASDYSFGILKFLTHLQMSLVEDELLTFPGFFFTCPVVHVGKLHFLLWCPLLFPHKNYTRFFTTSICVVGGSCLIYVICPTRFAYQMMFVSFNSNTKGVTIGAGTSNLTSSPVFSGVSVAQSFVFFVVFCKSLFVLHQFSASSNFSYVSTVTKSLLFTLNWQY